MVAANFAVPACAELNDIGLSKMRRQTVKNPLHLQRCLDMLCQPEEECRADLILRCYCWLAYSGLSAEDALCLTADDVDFSSMCVRYGGKSYPIYRESLQTLKSCAELIQFRRDLGTHGDTQSGVWYNRVPGKELMRGIRNLPSVPTMRAYLSRKVREMRESGKSDIELTYRHIGLSGIFYRMYEQELAGYKPNFNGVAAEFMGDKAYRLESGRNTLGAKRRKLAADYMTDYRRWKETP